LLRCSLLQGARFYSLFPSLSSAFQTNSPMSFSSTSAVSLALAQGSGPFNCYRFAFRRNRPSTKGPRVYLLFLLLSRTTFLP